MNTLTIASAALLAGVPNPTPEAPPGADGLLMVLNWLAWIALAMGVVGFIITGMMMMLQNSGRMGGGGESAGRLGWVMAGCIVVASAGGLVAMFS